MERAESAVEWRKWGGLRVEGLGWVLRGTWRRVANGKVRVNGTYST